MRLTVLGRYGPFPAANGACSGYLVEDAQNAILLDCGNGVLSKLLTYKRLEELDAIILSHLHSDHVSDLMVLRYAIDILKKRGHWIKPLPLYAPGIPPDTWKELDYNGVFELNEIKPNLMLCIGSMNITFAPMPHPVLNFAMSITDSNGQRLVYSGDVQEGDMLCKFAERCDLLLCDGGLLAEDKMFSGAPHLTAQEAGAVAAKANVRALLVTHLWFEHDEHRYLAQARQEYPTADVAREGYSYRI